MQSSATRKTMGEVRFKPRLSTPKTKRENGVNWCAPGISMAPLSADHPVCIKWVLMRANPSCFHAGRFELWKPSDRVLLNSTINLPLAYLPKHTFLWLMYVGFKRRTFRVDVRMACSVLHMHFTCISFIQHSNTDPSSLGKKTHNTDCYGERYCVKDGRGSYICIQTGVHSESTKFQCES